MEYRRNILITGGAGFIWSHVVRLFVNKYPEYRNNQACMDNFSSGDYKKCYKDR